LATGASRPGWLLSEETRLTVAATAAPEFSITSGSQWYPGSVATTKKRTSTAKPASRANGRSASNGIAPIRGKARREAIEALRERTSKPKGLSPELKARLKDDAWGKRLVDP
jgi:hypothetical protein